MNNATVIDVPGWKQMTVRLWDSRNIIEQLVKRDIAVRYRQSYLGYIWAILVPILIVTAFTYLANLRVLPVDSVPYAYPAFAIGNLVVWQLFASILIACSQSLSKAGSLTTKINFAKESLVLASLGQPIFDFLVKLPVVLSVVVYLDVRWSIGMAASALFLILLVLLATGIGFLLSIVNLVYRDTENFIGIAATYGMFLAPVLYSPPDSYPLFLVNVLNPASPILIEIQQLVASGMVNLDLFLVASVVIPPLVFIAGWRLFYIVLPVVIERA